MAAKITGLDTSGPDKFSQTINIRDEFGFDPTINEALTDRIGQAIIDEIVGRTLDGKDVSGQKFTGYESSYVKSDEFKAFGKSTKPNMKLTGAMLGTMDIVEASGETIKIGWNDDEERAKGYNHHTGDTIKNKREFFGVTGDELDAIKSKFDREIESSRDLETISKARTVGDLLTRANIGTSDGDATVVDIFTNAFLGLIDNG